MKLYDVPRKTWVKIVGETKVPPAGIIADKGERIFFDHIDGMYSYCTDEAGEIVHLAAWTEVEPCCSAR